MISTDLPILDIVILLAVGLLELIFAIYIFTRYERSPAITSFGLFAACVSGWVLTNGIGLMLERGSTAIDLVFRGSYLFAAFIFPIFYLFFLHFTLAERITRRFLLLLFIPPALLTGLIFFSKNLVVGFDTQSFVAVIFGGDFWVYTVYLLAFYILIVCELIYRYMHSEGLRRWQIRMSTIGILISGVVGLSANLILPMFNKDPTNWIGPGFSFVWLFFVWRVIRRNT